MKRVLTAIIFTVFLITWGCGTDEKAHSFRTTLSLINSGSEVTTYFYPHELITFELAVENLTDEPQTLTVSNPIREFNVLEYDNKANVWRWSNGKMWTANVEYLMFLPGETKSWQVEWDQTDNANTPVATGAYYAQGNMWTVKEAKNTNMTPGETRSQFLTFTIE